MSCCNRDQVFANPCQAIEDGLLTRNNYMNFGMTQGQYILLLAQCGTSSILEDIEAILGDMLNIANLSLTQLQAINENTDEVEAQLDALIVLITSGNATAADTLLAVQSILVETQAINANTDQVETLLNSMVSLLTSIDNNTDDLEASLVDLVALATSGNATSAQIELAVQAILSETQAINANTDQLETLLTTSNTLILSGNLTATQIEAINQSLLLELTTINSNTDGIESLLTSIRDNQVQEPLFGLHIINTGTDAIPINPFGQFNSWVIVKTNSTGTVVVDGITLTDTGDTTSDEASSRYKLPAPNISNSFGATYEWRTKE